MNIDHQHIIKAVSEQVHQALHTHKKIATLKTDGSWVTQVDLAIQNTLQAWLKQHYPDAGFLGEEMNSHEQQALLAEDRPLWVLDPLDGTSNFRVNLPVYATSLALIERNRTIFGVVYDPCRHEIFHAIAGKGAWLNGERLQLGKQHNMPLAQAIAAVDFKRLPSSLATRLASAPPYASQRSIGAIALDWCWVAAGRFSVYVHGKQKLWDYAAGELILVEAGGLHTTLQGDMPENLELEPRSAVCATTPELMQQWQAVLTPAKPFSSL